MIGWFESYLCYDLVAALYLLPRHSAVKRGVQQVVLHDVREEDGADEHRAVEQEHGVQGQEGKKPAIVTLAHDVVEPHCSRGRGKRQGKREGRVRPWNSDAPGIAYG